jgi:Leucine rich repeat
LFRHLALLFVLGAIFINPAISQEPCILPVINLNRNEIYLTLKNRQIYQICSEAFVGFNQLGTLDLSHNSLTTLPKNLFKPLKNIERIDLEKNKLTTISFDEFVTNRKLKELNLRSNNIQKIDLIQHEGEFSIKKLWLNANNLTNIFELCKLRQLESLELSANHNLDFKTFQFSCWRELQTLELANTDLKKLKNDYRLFADLAKLKKLLIPSNNLRVLCVGNFPELPALEVLDIKENYLNSLDARELKRKFPKLKKIYLSKNLWSCRYFDLLESDFFNLGLKVEGNTRDEVCVQTITATHSPISDACRSQNDETTTGTSITTPTTTFDRTTNSTIQPPIVFSSSAWIIWSLLLANGILFITAMFLCYFYFIHG